MNGLYSWAQGALKRGIDMHISLNPQKDNNNTLSQTDLRVNLRIKTFGRLPGTGLYIY